MDFQKGSLKDMLRKLLKKWVKLMMFQQNLSED